MRHSVQMIPLGLLLAGSGILPSHAQTAPTPASGRCYVGAAFIRNEYLVVSDTRRYVQGARPWEVVAGFQLAPRWAVQLGYSNRVSRTEATPTSFAFDSSPMYYGDERVISRTHAVPVLVRYTALEESRVQLDLVAGSTVVFSSVDREYQGVDIDQHKGEMTLQDRTTQKYVTAGFGVRYPLGQHFEGVFDWTYSRNLRGMSTEQRRDLSGNRWGLTRAVGLGLTYRFSGHKKPSAS